MRPERIYKGALAWRFREIGIEVRFWLDTRRWGGTITAKGRTMVLPAETLSTIITMHGLEAHVPCA